MEREKNSPSKNYRDDREKHSPSKNYRDIGEVVTLMDKINAALRAAAESSAQYPS